MVLVLTDGDDNDRRNFARLRDTIGRKSEEQGVQVHSIAVGDEVSQNGEDDLRDLAARGKGRYEQAPENEKLVELFRSRVTETVNECTLVYDSPYPTPDGFDRPVMVTIKTPSGPLTARAEYKIGPLLAGRSQPAAWRWRRRPARTPPPRPARQRRFARSVVRRAVARDPRRSGVADAAPRPGRHDGHGARGPNGAAADVNPSAAAPAARGPRATRSPHRHRRV